MLNRLSSAVMALMLLTSTIGCTLDVTSDVTSSGTVTDAETSIPTTIGNVAPSNTSHAPLTRECNSTVPNDFYIIFESSPILPDNFVTLLDTERNILGAFLIRNLVPGGYTSIDYCMPCEHLQAIYDAIIEYHIESYAGSHGHDVFELDGAWERITFCLGGEVYSIVGNFSVVGGEEYRDLQAFRSILWQCYRDNDAYRSLLASAQAS